MRNLTWCKSRITSSLFSIVIASTELRNNISTPAHVQCGFLSHSKPKRSGFSVLSYEQPRLVEYVKANVPRSKEEKTSNHCFHSVWRVFRSLFSFLHTRFLSESSTVNNQVARASCCTQEHFSFSHRNINKLIKIIILPSSFCYDFTLWRYGKWCWVGRERC